MLPALVTDRSPVPSSDHPPSPPALVRVDASLVGLAGAATALPLALAAGAGLFGVIDVFWQGAWGGAMRALTPIDPVGVGVLAPELWVALATAVRSAASLLFLLGGPAIALLASDELRNRLCPWDPAAKVWFERTHRTLVAGALVATYASGAPAILIALVVPLALWACRPAPRTRETARYLAVFAGLATVGPLLASIAQTLFTVLGPVTGSVIGLLQTKGLSHAEILRFLYLPFVQNGLAEGLGHCLGAGLFLAPLTVLTARVVRRALPAAPRLAVATLGFLPSLTLLGGLLNGLGLISGHTWIADGLREITLAAPVAQLQLWALFGWAGAAVLPHGAAALLGAGSPLPIPEDEEPPQLPAEAQPTAPGGLVASKTLLASS